MQSVSRKSAWRRLALPATMVAAALVPSLAEAATKANNTDNLNLTTSWTGGAVPGALDVAKWDNTLTGANSVALGANLGWLGIQIVDPGGAVTIASGNTLTLGTSGLDMSAATQSLTINAGLTLGGGGQTWNVKTGQTFTLGGALTRSTGATLLIDRSTNSGAVTASLTLANGLVGPWAIVRSTGTAANDTAAGYNFATVSGGNVVAYTGATAETSTGAWGGIASGDTGTVNYDISSAGNLGATGLSRTVNTIRYTGSGATQASNTNPVGNLLTINGLMNAGTGTFNIGGTGGTNNYGINVTVGSTNNLVLAAMSADILLRNGILNGSGGNSTVSIFGGDGRTVTISGATSNYSGATYVNGGTLQVSGTGSINTTSGIIINGSNARYVHTSSVASTRAITLTRGTLDGTGTVGAVTVGDGTGGIITNGNGSTTALTVSSLNFTGDATINLNLASGVGLNVTGALSTTPANGAVVVNATGSAWTLGTTNVIGFGTFSGSAGDFSVGTVTGLTARQAATGFVVSGNFLALNVDGDLPVWTGASSSTWTTATTGDNTGPNNWATKLGKAATNFWTADTIQFNDTYDLGSGAVTVGNRAIDIQGGNVSPGSVVFNNSIGDYTLSSSGGFGIASGSLTKSGSSALTINTANSYAGGTALNAGTLNLNNASALGTGALTIAGGTVDNTSGGAITFSANIAQNWNGDFTFTGTNDLDLGNGAVTVGGSGNRVVTVTGGTLSVGELKTTGTGQGFTKQGAGSLILTSDGTGSTASVIGGVLNVAGGTLQMNRSSGNNGDATAAGITGSGTITNGAAIERWLFSNATSGTFDFSGTLANGGAGALGVNKSGASTQILSGTNSYTGLTTAGGGTLSITGMNTGAGTNVTLVGGATLVLGNTAALGGASLINLTPAGTATVRYATDGTDTAYQYSMSSGSTINFVLDRATAGTDVTHNLSTAAVGSGFGSGTLNFTAGANVSGTATASFDKLNLGGGSGGTTLVAPAAGTVVTIGSVTKSNNSTAQTIGLDGVTTGNSITGAISNGPGVISVTKSNLSTWTLSGSSSYSGVTTINGGTLGLVATDNNIASSAKILVNSAGTLDVSGVSNGFALGSSQRLAGTGNVHGGVTASAAGSSIAPGDVGTVGSLTVDNSVNLSGGTLAEDVDFKNFVSAATGDQLVITAGNISLGGNLTISLLNAGSQPQAVSQTVVIINNTGSGTLSGSFGSLTPVANVTYNVLYNFDAATSTADAGNDVAIQFTAVPEPTSIGLLGMAGVGLLRRRRRRA